VGDAKENLTQRQRCAITITTCPYRLVFTSQALFTSGVGESNGDLYQPRQIRPLHEQFLDQMRYLILTGVWTLLDLLSSDSELQHQSQISHSIVRQVLGNAGAQGLAVSDAKSSDRQARRVRRQDTSYYSHS